MLKLPPKPIPKLTPIQLDTLTSFYYGEVHVDHTPVKPDGTKMSIYTFTNADGINISGRVKSLFGRRLLRRKYRGPTDWEAPVLIVQLTDAGIAEMERIGA